MTAHASRIAATAVLLVACFALAFTQLGFAGIGLPRAYEGYAVVMLLPVAVAALMLGTIAGTLVGLVAGTMLYVHVLSMPLDYYELEFVTPVTSVVMLTVAGLMLGILFAFVLRNDPGRVRRIVYIAIVCLVVSFLYSLGFMTNVVVGVIADIASHVDVSGNQAQLTADERNAITYTAIRMGDGRLQMLVDALLMALSCGVADSAIAFVVKRNREGNLSVRFLFTGALATVALVAFMLTAAASFASITQAEYRDARADMASEAGYLCKQLDVSDRHAQLLSDFLDKVNTDKVDAQSMMDLVETVSTSNLLDGYTEAEDGIILVSANGYVFLTDAERFSKAATVDDILVENISTLMAKSVETGQPQRFVYEERSEVLEKGFDGDGIIRARLAYLFSEETNGYAVTIIYPAEKVYADREGVMIWTTLSFFVLLTLISLMTLFLLNRLVVRRIDETNKVLGRVTAGDLDAVVDVHDTREFESLSEGINDTVLALKGWISEAATRMDAELATAKAIQESALPRVFPPYPSIRHFDVYATMNAAKEVGGDFYDFFLIGDDCGPDHGKLGFMVADVSGKGVPAALFMMKAKTQIRDYMASGMELGEAIENANRQLCDGNDAGMFVTAFVGVLDYGTGRVEYVNAGHNPPLLWQEGAWSWLKQKSGLPLGLFDGFPYEAFSVDCKSGDQFLVYSDGVTEAMSAQDELYGESRLLAVADANYVRHPRMLVEAVRDDVAKHALGAEQSDDITILALEVGVPPEITATLTVLANVDELPNVNKFIHTELDRRLCPSRVQGQLDIAVEELFVNVAHYAYPDATPEDPGTVRVSYTYHADPASIVVEIADEGIAYDPLAKPDAVTPDDIADVPIGGLGILMAKRSVDKMTYERVDGSNVVTITKSW